MIGRDFFEDFEETFRRVAPDVLEDVAGVQILPDLLSLLDIRDVIARFKRPVICGQLSKGRIPIYPVEEDVWHGLCHFQKLGVAICVALYQLQNFGRYWCPPGRTTQVVSCESLLQKGGPPQTPDSLRANDPKVWPRCVFVVIYDERLLG